MDSPSDVAGIHDTMIWLLERSHKNLPAGNAAGESEGALRKTARRIALLPVLAIGVAIYGCAGGNVLTIPDALGRPSSKEVAKPQGSPRAAVIDFSWKPGPSSEIGRDYDNVRPIVWSGNSGKAMADLIAAVLEERKIPVARVSKPTDVPAGVPATILGTVEVFRVDARRARGVAVEIEASIALKLTGFGPGVPRGWGTTVTSSYRYPEPLFIMAGDVLHALNQAANDVAEESVRQLTHAGFFAASPSRDTTLPAPAEEPGGVSPPEQPIRVEEVK